MSGRTSEKEIWGQIIPIYDSLPLVLGLKKIHNFKGNKYGKGGKVSGRTGEGNMRMRGTGKNGWYMAPKGELAH